MRNLSLLSATTSRLPCGSEDHAIKGIAVDLDENVTYVASESIVNADVNVRIWSVDDDGQFNLFSEGFFSFHHGSSQIIALNIIADTRTLCVILRCGDIAIAALDSPSPGQPLDTIGTVDPTPVLAASFSPDSSLLTIVASQDQPTLLLMDSSSFDVISTSGIVTSSYGEDNPITVGWGSKSTQFHGSLGKSAAQVPTVPERGTISPDDDEQPHVSWRGDAQYFTVSIVQDRKRVLRVYNRQAVLQNTAENVPGLEHSLAWKPSGGLIASTQRFGGVPGLTKEEQAKWALGKGREGRHDVVFFERNGLRHGEFSLREPASAISEGLKWVYSVKEIGWNADSTVFSVWIERQDEDVVQLWTMSNYHYYLKMEIPVPRDSRHFTHLYWHPENPFCLLLSTQSTLLQTHFSFSTPSSKLQPPNDTGLVAVTDGSSLLLTPFRTQNIPPPMCTHRLTLPAHSPPIHIAFASTPLQDTTIDLMATLWLSGKMSLWAIHTNIEQKKGGRDILVVKEVWNGVVLDADVWPRQVLITKAQNENGKSAKWFVSALGDRDGKDVVSFVVLEESSEGNLGVFKRREVAMSTRNGRLVNIAGNALEASAIIWQDRNGELWSCTGDNILPEKLAVSFPEFCATATQVLCSEFSSPVFIGLSSPKLHVASLPSSILSQGSSSVNLTLSTSCTSYTLTSSFLIFTTTAPAHESVYVPLSSLHVTPSNSVSPRDELSTTVHTEPKSTSASATLTDNGPEKRRVERGARIVTVVPSTMSLVLQMPRGNLETIRPRVLVLERVAFDVKSGSYQSAFLACRKNRMDLTLLVTLDLEKFERNIGAFVEQVEDVECINLFLSALGRSSLPQETVTRLCDCIRVELEQRNLEKYVNSILTAHVVKTPPDLEAGLGVLLKLCEKQPHIVEDAVKYIIFLVDVNKLFDIALGMYDFSLVLLVAQYAQKDPREYLPFLRSLSALSKAYQHFKINDHLKRHVKALASLHEVGPERFEEAKAYVEKHDLYLEALRLWKGEGERYERMMEAYGQHLFERREFGEAGLVFMRAKCPRKAMIAYEKALQWQELFDVVIAEGFEGDELVEIALRVADDLSLKQRHIDAARVLFDYAGDVGEGIAALVRGGAWSEARRVAVLHRREDLLTDLIFPGTLEAQIAISEEIIEITELMEKQVGRLDELAEKKIAEPEAFYGMDDATLANVDVMTDVSNPGTMFTRYTVAPTLSDRSKRTSRSKRKLDRKAGRKGTAEEEEYLLRSLSKLVTRLSGVQAEAKALLPHLAIISSTHATKAMSLQEEVEGLERSLRNAVDRIWKEREDALAIPEKNDVPGSKDAKLLEKVPKPSLADVPWKIDWLDTSIE